MDFDHQDYWKAIVLFGLNQATYKMALAKVLLKAHQQGKTELDWHSLSSLYFDEFEERLSHNHLPQQANPSRQTKMERIWSAYKSNKYNRDTAIQLVGEEAFADVIPRFHTIGRDPSIAADYFYETQFGTKLILKDALLGLQDSLQLTEEVDARWSLLEGAFVISHTDFELANSTREIYMQSGSERRPLTPNIPFLSGYQGNTCFYCGENLSEAIHVDHVLPRQVMLHDEVWNLVLAHPDCNLLKSDRLVGAHFIEKLIARNENIMGSNHPWKAKIATALGKTANARAQTLQQHYSNTKLVLGQNYWGGAEGYNPATDPFYRRLITALNNR